MLVEIYAAGINSCMMEKMCKGQCHKQRYHARRDVILRCIKFEGPKEYLGKPFLGNGWGDLGFIKDGSHAQYLMLPQSAVSEKPANLSFEEAAP